MSFWSAGLSDLLFEQLGPVFSSEPTQCLFIFLQQVTYLYMYVPFFKLLKITYSTVQNMY